MNHYLRSNMPMNKSRPGFAYVRNLNFEEAVGTTWGNLNARFVRLDPAINQMSATEIERADIDPSETLASFYPVVRVGPNYLRYCGGALSQNERPRYIGEPVLKYTSGEGWFCTTINLALASDTPNLKRFSTYIKQLKHSIAKLPIYYHGTVMRGMNMSRSEVTAYETLGRPFYIPSFTSTSKSHPFGGNTVLHIDLSSGSSKDCMEVPPQFTTYQHEEEILLTCYSRYSYERTEKSNGQRIIKLRLLNSHKPIPIYGWDKRNFWY
ncbi:unnamed protein product [Rotaria socialis]|uniref:NAD(+)--protein-arginine ADP-ribosyltransferase n=2 Tax=Rotaria socialis TaxID=392032 RepID=A0A821E3U5_9BILA|nr:unnamed protein product [Rotaria socialis]